MDSNRYLMFCPFFLLSGTCNASMHFVGYFVWCGFILSVDRYLGYGTTNCREIFCDGTFVSLTCLLPFWEQYP